ncbi:hypothetical protein AKJ64_02045 [candidate division MSBL1 archaeon SCGC-AAA259E17]|uniref:Nudix hydrolase domain-containing protein n=1 Tax=candidate division MSBL1 archaeon SCGC-AAA259E17 TaxID=1698263 RepID=A0A133UF93_9EURY|nr:hypothetical protein AKJ64_02045 [candidate division MSBL1 archaeon SCGC-AAA259E17]
MEQEKIPDIVKTADEKLPHFEDGRIDYSNAKKAPIVVLFLKYREEILILKRSKKVGTHPKRWGFVAGYLDELKSIKKKGLEELSEETGIERNQIKSIKKKGVYEWRSKEENKDYTSFLFLVELTEKPEIDLSWEHEEYKWIKIKKAEQYLSSNALEELKIVLP